MITVYTDGSCLGNPGLGGMGIVVVIDGKYECHFGIPSEEVTTNNRMELGAVVFVLKHLYEIGINDNITVITDSNYVVKSVTEWLDGWIAKDFKKVKNVDLWKEMVVYRPHMNVTYKWVKGHADDHYNEIADSLAVKAAKTQKFSEDYIDVQH